MNSAQSTSFDWPENYSRSQKHELAYRIVNSLNPDDSFLDFFRFLRRIDNEFYLDFGGEILSRVINGSVEKYSTSFDERYKRLILLYANFDLQEASEFHIDAAELYQNSSNSFVRYERLCNSFRISIPLVESAKQSKSGNSMHPILPMLQGFEKQTFSLSQVSTAFSNSYTDHARLSVFKLSEDLHRDSDAACGFNDGGAAESMWLRKINTHTINQIRFYSLPNARISKSPTGIAFHQNNEWRYLHSMSDMYHYFRISGKTIFGPAEHTLEQAYVLPRFGQKNYYCSLINKVPALFGYHFLGLECPIVSAYELNREERHFAKLLNIDIDNIHVDIDSEITIKNAIFPDNVGLRTLFVRYCATLPKAASTFGKRIYISRACAADRTMDNEAEIEQMLLAQGFDVVAFENHTLEEQMAIAAGAQVIAAPHGAGLANMIFSNPGTSILEFVPEFYMVPSMRQLAADCGHKYSMLIGQKSASESTEQESLGWSIELNGVAKMLDGI